MATDPSPPSQKSGGMTSLYANLLDSSSASTPGSISRAPVTFQQQALEASSEQDDAAKKQQALAASLRFQPTKRPQLAAQKAKAKAVAAKFAQLPKAAEPTTTPSQPAEPAPAKTVTPVANQNTTKTTIADWTATASDDDANAFYGSEKRQRGGRKKRKKAKGTEEIPQNWDDIYDPSRPNNYEEYKHSDEKIREIRDWKDRLYAHRIRRTQSSDYDSEEEDRRPRSQFAPPSSMTFAPPKFDDEPPSMPTPPPPPPPADIPDEASGEDAYARRLRLSQQQQSQPPPPPPTVDVPSPPVLPPSTTPAQPPPGQISRAPVRYHLPAASSDLPSSEAELAAAVESAGSDETLASSTPASDESRSLRPGQAGFAERLLAKQGWSKGTGLGARGTGIINPLYAKADKRKKKSDAEGGGFATPANTGKILGGAKSAKSREEGSKFGNMSEAIVLKGMLKGMDMDDEMTRGEGGIVQEIGEECGEKYGNVERVYIHRHSNEQEDGATVFVRFTSQLSALRAVNALEGRVFNGNVIEARFWEREKFDSGVFE